MKDSNVEALIEPCGKCKPCTNIKSSHIINFDSLTKYKAVIKSKEYRSQTKDIVNKMIADANIHCINPQFIEITEADAKEIEKAKKTKNKKG